MWLGGADEDICNGTHLPGSGSHFDSPFSFREYYSSPLGKRECQELGTILCDSNFETLDKVTGHTAGECYLRLLSWF